MDNNSKMKQVHEDLYFSTQHLAEKSREINITKKIGRNIIQRSCYTKR
jgi:hypothetical protein